MSEVAGVIPAAPIGPNPVGQNQAGQNQAGQKLFTELRVSGHLMTLDTGLFCIVQTPGVRRPDDRSGLPGVRISLPPGPASRPHAVAISAFREDGWLSGAADAALVRVSDGPAQVLVTIYQLPGTADAAPRLQVLRLSEEPTAPPPIAAPQPPPLAAMPPLGMVGQASAMPDIIAHIQMRGDVGASLGEWVGERGSKRWIEGFVIAPRSLITAGDLEYQAVLGRGWLSPWVEGGQLCGSRGMALPILGFKLRLRGAATERFTCFYAATFTDGAAVGPVPADEVCEAKSLAPIEAFQIVLRERGATPTIAPAKPERAPASKAKPVMPPARGAKPKPPPPRRGR